MFSLGMVGAGQFAGTFAKLFRLHPAVSEVRVTDLLPNRAEELAERENIGPAVGSFEEMLGSDVDSVAIFT